MARHPLDGDIHPVAAGGADGDLLDGAAVEIEGQSGLAEIDGGDIPGPVQPHLLLDPEEERQRRAGEAAPQDLQCRRQHDADPGPVVGAEAGVRVGALHEPSGDHRLGPDAHRNRIHVGHEQPARPGHRAGELDDEVADVALRGRFRVGVVEVDRGSGAAGGLEVVDDPFSDRLLVTGDAGDREEIDDELPRRGQIGRRHGFPRRLSYTGGDALGLDRTGGLGGCHESVPRGDHAGLACGGAGP